MITSRGKMSSSIVFISVAVSMTSSVRSVLNWSGRGHDGRLSVGGGRRGSGTLGIVVGRLQDVGRS